MFYLRSEKKCASFEYSPNNTAQFIVTKMSIKLYYRPPKVFDKAGANTPTLIDLVGVWV